MNHKQVRDCFHVINRKVFPTQKLAHRMAAYKCKSFSSKRKLMSSARNSFCLQNGFLKVLITREQQLPLHWVCLFFSCSLIINKAFYYVERLFRKSYWFLVIIRFTQIPTFCSKNRLSFPNCVQLVNMSTSMDYNLKTT